ncbi:MAG: YbaN family protein [Candidatus Palauibacterales bacterium]|nr:YbaN family protein [Candidatus Palauibacterales bacterium]MDP2483735.1 YbaN family protein [Candidatus Palauibacterales bacterium]
MSVDEIDTDSQRDARLVPQPGASVLPGRSVRRWLFLLLGLLSVGLGFIGVFVPGLPTTVFLILASYFFTRSCPWLESKLVRSRIFRPYLKYLDGERAMPLRARLTTIAMIWAAVGSSFLLMGAKGALAPWFVAVVGGAAVVGSVVVAFVFRERRSGGEG